MRKNRDVKPHKVPLTQQLKDQALLACLRIVAAGLKRAMALITQGPGAWTCGACGPLPAGASPLHGSDEVLYCPDPNCLDGVVRAALDPEPLKRPGSPWRSAPAVGLGGGE